MYLSLRLVTDVDKQNKTAQSLTVGDAACKVSAAPSHLFPGPGAQKGHPARNRTESGKKRPFFAPRFTPLLSQFLAPGPISYLHEELDALVVTQEIVAQLHPLRHQVEDLPFPLQSLPPILLPSAALGTVGAVGVKASAHTYIC